MSIHINAKQGDIAETILLPGDPLRAQYIAENFLEDASCYNQVRGMLGFTGMYKGRRISVQGTGMGVPSISIYVTELIREYGVKQLIRVGTCGGIQQDVKVRDVVLAMAATTDSNANRLLFPDFNYAPHADFELLQRAYRASQERKLSVKVGNILTADTFYRESMEPVKKLAEYGVLAVEMESSALYTIAARHQAKALSVLTVSDHLFSGETDTTAEERQTTFNDMIVVALEAAIQSS
ncbi:purine-nucleoside phosphorylase [Paenibacillus sacheonensis]|uniref:Purine nucleoside phosphorylase DeoD-type n=1 Tax=Paenibacillus sacheonensis TaxID=742054 RepID=A0A7X5BXE8_9BACL|nr:purine-nucleoside phosphorylase [Paenibacillus sacheonensis]MBM7563123.1 purine-nucleoside phosphorylase [Paenibacillus sacheonensis]NBC68311.1 purine-nucleoside phosphorylase [Paenibacillus sacheonensis]